MEQVDKLFEKTEQISLYSDYIKGHPEELEKSRWWRREL